MSLVIFQTILNLAHLSPSNKVKSKTSLPDFFQVVNEVLHSRNVTRNFAKARLQTIWSRLNFTDKTQRIPATQSHRHRRLLLRLCNNNNKTPWTSTLFRGCRPLPRHSSTHITTSTNCISNINSNSKMQRKARLTWASRNGRGPTPRHLPIALPRFLPRLFRTPLHLHIILQVKFHHRVNDYHHHQATKLQRSLHWGHRHWLQQQQPRRQQQQQRRYLHPDVHRRKYWLTIRGRSEKSPS